MTLKPKKLTTSIGEQPQQLRMLVLGHGGTGMSMLIGAITEIFKVHRSKDKLAKCTTSGVAAIITGGQTLHSWQGFRSTTPTKRTGQTPTTQPFSRKGSRT